MPIKDQSLTEEFMPIIMTKENQVTPPPSSRKP
jgi:hypothetical protein